MKQEDTGRGYGWSLIGILIVWYWLHKQSQKDTIFGRGIKWGLITFYGFIANAVVVSALGALALALGVPENFTYMAAMLLIFGPLLWRFLKLLGPLLWLGLGILALGYLIRLIIHLATGEPF